jgi:hypothetical protein
MPKKLLQILPFFFICYLNFSFAQVEAVPNITLKLDVTTAIFVNTFGASGDFDAVKIDSSAYFGCRLGLNTFNKGTVGGPSAGSPYTDIDFLGRVTIFGKVVEVDLCPGFTYHKGKYSFPLYGEDKEGVFGKLEGDLKVKFYKSLVGLILKFGFSREGYGGLGLFIGFSTRDK